MTAQTDIEEKALHWFVVLRDDDAPESAWLEFQDWLEASPTHAAAYDAVERLWVDLDAPAAPTETPVIDLAAARARRAKTRLPWLGAAIGIAASVTLAVGLFLWLTPGSQIYATTDAPLTVALEDGSHVYLNRHSTLDVRFDGDNRSVSLTEGEAAFDIAHDPAHPLIVAAGDHQVEVLGDRKSVV